MVKALLKGKVIATAGPLPGQLTDENLENWIKLRQGKYSKDMAEDVTHLICSPEQFQKRVARGKSIYHSTPLATLLGNGCLKI
jgi:hypothetical protein